MGAHAAQALWNRLSAAARVSKGRRTPDDDRTMDHRRADIMAGLGLLGTWTDLPTDLQTATDVFPATPRPDATDHTDAAVTDADGHTTGPADAVPACACGGSGANSPTPTTTGGIELRVSIAFSTLLGVDDQPGELDGYGPIPAALARTIAFGKNTVWRRLVTDELGRLIDYGTTRYRPPKALERHVKARDQHCRAYGCHRRAVTAELDHVIPFARGGPTDATNLEALCGRDHDVKHEAGWQVTRQPDGTTVWTTPGGIVRTVEPATYPVDTTARLRRQPVRIVVDQWWPHAA